MTLTCTIAALKVFGPVYVLTRGGPGNSTIVPAYYRHGIRRHHDAGRP